MYVCMVYDARQGPPSSNPSNYFPYGRWKACVEFWVCTQMRAGTAGWSDGEGKEGRVLRYLPGLGKFHFFSFVSLRFAG